MCQAARDMQQHVAAFATRLRSAYCLRRGCGSRAREPTAANCCISRHADAPGPHALARVRIAACGHHHQLCRPPGTRRAGAVSADADRLERNPVRLHRHRIPGRLRAGLVVQRCGDRPVRNARRLRAGDRHLEPGGDGACAGHQRGGLCDCAFFSGAGRVRQLPRRAQDGGGMVPASRARTGHRHLQFRLQYRRHRRAVTGAGDRHRLGLAGGISVHRRTQHNVAAGVVAELSPARAATGFVGCGVGTYPQRCARAGAAAAVVVAGAAASAGLGLRAGQVHHRPDLVVLPVLAAQVPACRIRLESVATGRAVGASTVRARPRC